MEEKTYSVYQHINKIDGKRYVGITCQNPEARWGINGKNYYSCPKFYAAIEKYGWDNFEHIIIEEGLTKDEACLKEQYYINIFNSLTPNGYNLTTGGEMTEMSEEAKNKLSQSMMGNQNGLGKKCSEEKRKKISDAQKGKSLTEEHKQKLRKPKNVTHPCSEEKRQNIIKAKKDKIPVYCLETSTIYESVQECARQLNLHASLICKVCKGKLKTTGGYHLNYYTEE